MKPRLFLPILLINFLFAQNQVKEKLTSHVYYLSDDKLEGRATGSEGEKLALEYISENFESYGLTPKGEEGYVQAFDFTLGKKLVGNNFLAINDKNVMLKEAYFPLNYSASAKVLDLAVHVGFGINAGEVHNDYENLKDLKGKVFIMNLSSPDGIHPHSKYTQYSDYQTKINTAILNGASAVIFFNEDENLEDPKGNLSMNLKAFPIPVLFLKNQEVKNGDLIAMEVSMEEDNRTGHNVLAYLDNGAESTVVIGAHYDHLGWGESGGSLYRGDAAIHNGADDNASGVALMLELARSIKEEKLTNNNYLFIAFSGEELGLYGSKSFVKHATVDTATINYMLNFDMVGRLDEENTMAVNGVGTASIFKEKAVGITAGNIQVKTTESGMGPSDHASFYLANKPVLHFYTGNNPDYHKPSDDADLINFEGMKQVYDYTMALLTDLDDEGKMIFIKTKDEDNRNAPKFSVTLGVVPDYMYDGEGMRIDGVTEGKPAFGAGIIPGDIVVKLGGVEVTDMMAYMTALSKLKKGDLTKVKVLREKKILELDIQF